MDTWIELGYNCDFKLWHPDLGEEGFLYYDARYSVNLELGRQMDEHIMVVRTEVENSKVSNQIQIAMRIGESQQGPGGAMRLITRQAEKELIYSYLKKQENLVLITIDGVWVGIETETQVVSETIFPEFTVIIIKFNSLTELGAPIDTLKWEKSVWSDGAGGFSEWSDDPDDSQEFDAYWS